MIFKGAFDFPKNPEVIEEWIAAICDLDSVIIDSFAGSGTTGHAVLNLNKQDNGNRKFILIEMEDYAETITAERVKRVMQGYGEGKNAVEGTGGGFDYYTLGPALFDDDGNLNEAVGTEKIRAYVWYSETRSVFQASDGTEPYLLGKADETAYYFIYEPAQRTTLDYESLSQIKTKAGHYVIYADNCLLTKDYLIQHNIVFKKIPRDISRF
jgi:adenine-specific DNA-methyltransferase